MPITQVNPVLVTDSFFFEKAELYKALSCDPKAGFYGAVGTHFKKVFEKADPAFKEEINLQDLLHAIQPEISKSIAGRLLKDPEENKEYPVILNFSALMTMDDISTGIYFTVEIKQVFENGLYAKTLDSIIITPAIALFSIKKERPTLSVVK